MEETAAQTIIQSVVEMPETNKKEYEPSELLRIFTKNGEHYTAVVTKKKTIYEVKNPINRKKEEYANVDEWCKSIPDEEITPESIVSDNLSYNDAVKSKKMYIPGKRSHLALRLLRYVGIIVRDNMPELANKEEVIEAFNEAIDCFRRYSSLFATRLNNYSVTLLESFKYRRLRNYAFIYAYHDQWDKFLKIENELIASYDKFYNLVKTELETYHQTMCYKYYYKQQILSDKKYMDKHSRTVERRTRRYNEDMKMYDRKKEQRINESNQHILKLQSKYRLAKVEDSA
jgi:hypothetical protein